MDGNAARESLAGLEWRLVPEEARDGPTQMALEEVAAHTALEEGICTVRAFSWEPSTLSLGYGQDPETVDWAFCEAEGIDVTRRQTGGGGIYHDAHADVSYTVVAPAAAVPGDLMASYELLCTPILAALDRLGVDAGFAADPAPALYHPACYLREINPAHDVVAGGKKLSGNAQYRQRDAVIQHGSISYARRPGRHLGVFAAPGVTPDEFRDRVTSVREQTGSGREPSGSMRDTAGTAPDQTAPNGGPTGSDRVDSDGEARVIDRAAVVATLEDALTEFVDAEVGVWSDEELEAAAELAEEKYADPAWVRRRPR